MRKRKITILAYRSNGKESKKIEWFFIIFAFICVGLFLFCLIKTNYLTKGELYYKILAITCGVLGLLNIIFSITTLITIKKNNKIKEACVKTWKNKIFYVCDINGNEIIIKPNEFIKVERSFFYTNNSVLIYYKSNNIIKKINIGWTEDIDALKRLITKDENK